MLKTVFTVDFAHFYVNTLNKFKQIVSYVWIILPEEEVVFAFIKVLESLCYKVTLSV